MRACSYMRILYGVFTPEKKQLSDYDTLGINKQNLVIGVFTLTRLAKKCYHFLYCTRRTGCVR